jgi:uncharacterized protein (TIGR02679 family)
MTPIPPGLRAYLLAPTLTPLWAALRGRLERNGHAVRGFVTVQFGDDGADRLSGLLGRPVSSGPVRVRLSELDTALLSSAAKRGLVSTVGDLTGGPLRNFPAERDAARAGREQLWSSFSELLTEHGLSDEAWVAPWVEWLRRSGLLTRLPAARAAAVSSVSIQVLARVLSGSQPLTGLAELASEITGDAHGLDDGSRAAALILRGLAVALGLPPAASAAERRALWQRVGVSTDEISGTVLVWAFRPPGRDRWSAMMRERAELGLITHLTVHELRRVAELTSPGQIVHACENPQVLQRLAAAEVDRPVACFSGNPAAAGGILLARTVVHYHGDFDWPGVSIARRIFERGARPWLFGRDDYLGAVDRLPAENQLSLTGRAEPTPWDAGLSAAMAAVDVAVHEEAIVGTLLADLRQACG